MRKWDINTLRNLDKNYAKKGILPRNRPFQAALDILGEQFCIGIAPFNNPEVKIIEDEYRKMRSDTLTSSPGMGIGMVAVEDDVKKINIPVIFGQCNINIWEFLGFENEDFLKSWCRNDIMYYDKVSLSFADLFDFCYGLSDLSLKETAQEDILWKKAKSNLSDYANILPNTPSVETVIQPIFLTMELSLKAALVHNGASPDSFQPKNKKKLGKITVGGEGHNLEKLAVRLSNEKPHRDDDIILRLISKLPNYVKSRYEESQLSRLEIVKIALVAQFIASSSVRRYSHTDYALEVESESSIKNLRNLLFE